VKIVKTRRQHISSPAALVFLVLKGVMNSTKSAHNDFVVVQIAIAQ
jgi:hypothetical protein